MRIFIFWKIFLRLFCFTKLSRIHADTRFFESLGLLVEDMDEIVITNGKEQILLAPNFQFPNVPNTEQMKKSGCDLPANFKSLSESVNKEFGSRLRSLLGLEPMRLRRSTLSTGTTATTQSPLQSQGILTMSENISVGTTEVGQVNTSATNFPNPSTLVTKEHELHPESSTIQPTYNTQKPESPVSAKIGTVKNGYRMSAPPLQASASYTPYRTR